MADGGELKGYIVKPSSVQLLKKKILAVVVPSPQRTGEDYKYFTDSLLSKGCALFVYDNRRNQQVQPDFPIPSTKEMGISIPKHSYLDIALDAAEIYRYLRALPRLSKYKMGFVGHSEGGISALAASCMVRPDFLVEIASVSTEGWQLLYSQNIFLTPGKLELLKQMFSLSERELSLLVQKASELIVRDSVDYQQFQQEMMESINLSVGDQHKKELLGYFIRAQWTLHNKHDMAMLGLRPLDYYRKVKCPILFIACTKDEMTYALRDITTFEKLMYKTNKRFYSVCVNATHSFQKVPSYLMHHKLGDFKHDKDNSRDCERVSQVTDLIRSWINEIL